MKKQHKEQCRGGVDVGVEEDWSSGVSRWKRAQT